MKVSLIAALAANGVIGRDGDLPWRLPDDMKQFRRRTIDGAVVMGRKTWESFEGPLKRRLNVVVTRQAGYAAEGAVVVGSLDEALLAVAAAGHDEAVVIGGASLYALALERADEMILTHVEAEVEGDVRFPEVDWSAWRPVSEEAHPVDARNAHAFRVVTYTRAT